MSTSPLDAPNPREDKLVEIVHMTAIVSGAVALGGLIFVFVLVDKLLEKGLKPSAIVVFLMFSLAAVFGISGLLIRQLSRVLSAYLGPDEKEKRRLRKNVVPQLEAPREPVDSVTEHTTRAFEPVLRERE
jgi:hypothetical protein